MPDTTQTDPQPAPESASKAAAPAADVGGEHDASVDTTVQRGVPTPGEPAELAESADGTEAHAVGALVQAVASVELTREPTPLVWADTGEPVGAAVQLIPPYERRVSRTARGEMVTGVRVTCADGYGRRVHVDLAAAQTRMASVWDDRDTTPVALLQLMPEAGSDEVNDLSEHSEQAERDTGIGEHAGPVVVTTDPFDYFRIEQIATDRYPNLETALVALIGLLDR